MRVSRRRCEFCKKSFVPDSRVGNRQRACDRKECRSQRRKASQTDWLQRHPDAFRGRYPKLRRWLDRNRDYLRSYRKTHPDKEAERRKQDRERRARRSKARVDIQDTIQLQLLPPPKPTLVQGSADIQDEMPPQLLLLIGLALSNARVDMQDSMARPIAAAYDLGRELCRWANQIRQRQEASLC